MRPIGSVPTPRWWRSPIGERPGRCSGPWPRRRAGGQWSGGPELAIENATEALASAARAVDQVPLAEYDCQISGVNDLAGSGQRTGRGRATRPASASYTVEDVDGDS